MRLNPFCRATHSSQQGLVLNLALLPCWTHYINYKYNKIQFKSSLTTFYIQVLFSATDFSFDWVLKFYVWNQIVRYSSAGVALNFEPAKKSGQWHDVWNRPTFIQRFANSRDNLCSAAPSLLLKINSIFFRGMATMPCTGGWADILVVYRLSKIPRNSGWGVNGKRFFGSSHWKIPGTNGNSEKVVPFSRLGRSEWKFVYHLQVSWVSY